MMIINLLKISCKPNLCFSVWSSYKPLIHC